MIVRSSILWIYKSEYMSHIRRLYFTKMQGAGNDYLYVDALGSPTSIDLHKTDLRDLSKSISDRHFGVGGDGLIAILPSVDADFRMRMFNSDGSEAQMCGNGTRCVAKYLYDKGFTDKTVIRLETLAGVKILHLHVEAGVVKSVTVDMGMALLNRGDIPVVGDPASRMEDTEIEIDGERFLIDGIGMGNPHGVIFTERLDDRLVHHFGPLLESHPIWPEKANIEFARVDSPCDITMRVWERGAGETLACGTGACATLVAAYLKGLTGNEADLHLLGGTLHIRYDDETGHVFMTGPAEFIAEVEYFYDAERSKEND